MRRGGEGKWYYLHLYYFNSIYNLEEDKTYRNIYIHLSL